MPFAAALAAMVACGGGSPTADEPGRPQGKADESGPIDATGVKRSEWITYTVSEEVLLGPDYPEALIRLRVPKNEGMRVVAPPIVTLIVRVLERDKLTDANFASVLYHDYYVSGPNKGTHKYQIRLAPSRADIVPAEPIVPPEQPDALPTGERFAYYALAWDVPEVVGDPDNATTWAVSLNSLDFPRVGRGAAIVGLRIEFKAATADAGPQWYEADFWTGEWPVGYRVLKQVTVDGRAKPREDADAASCTLTQGDAYHPWTETPVLSRSAILRYTAQVDNALDFYEVDAAGTGYELRAHAVKKGDTVEELTYLSEGACRLRHAGAIVDTMCIDSDERYRMVPGQEPMVEEWFQARCHEGIVAWISRDAMEPHLTSGVVDAYIPYEILDPLPE